MSNFVIDSISDKSIVFRYIGVPHGLNTVGGIGLWYESEKAAKSDFKHFHNYLITASNLPRRFDLSFERDSSDTHCLTIDVAYPTVHYRISVDRINSEYVDRLRKSLESLPYVFIVAGYTDDYGQQQILSPSEYNFFVSTFSVDGNQVEGNRNAPWPEDIFRPSPVRVVEEDSHDSHTSH